MEYEALNDFELYSKVPEEVIAKYVGKIPEKSRNSLLTSGKTMVLVLFWKGS